MAPFLHDLTGMNQLNLASGCQGFKGPIPSTLLDELSETSFHSSLLHGLLLTVPAAFIFLGNALKTREMPPNITYLGDTLLLFYALACSRTAPGRAAMLLLVPRLSE